MSADLNIGVHLDLYCQPACLSTLSPRPRWLVMNYMDRNGKTSWKWNSTCICVLLCTRVNESRLCVKKKKKKNTSRAVDGLGWYSACVWMRWELKGDERSGGWLQTRCYCSHVKSISVLLGKGREVKNNKLITECNKNKCVWYINANGQNPFLGTK